MSVEIKLWPHFHCEIAIYIMGTIYSLYEAVEE